MKLCFATNNPDKLKEVGAMLDRNFQLISLKEIGCTEELREEQKNLEGNSLQKAEYVFSHYHVPCFADDTGLEIDSLQGAPGVDTAYYGGPHRSADDNMNRVLNELNGVSNRQAQFRTVITLVTSKGVRQFEGAVKGKISNEKRGAEGFGYNPIFIPDGYGRTMAEMSLAEKNAISHRAIAIQHLINFLKDNPDFVN